MSSDVPPGVLSLQHSSFLTQAARCILNPGLLREVKASPRQKRGGAHGLFAFELASFAVVGRTPHSHVPCPLPGSKSLGYHLRKAWRGEENLFEAYGCWAWLFLCGFVWLRICSLKTLHCVALSPACHRLPHTAMVPGQCPWPGCPALPCLEISQADTQRYNAILVFESLDLKGKIPCKSHAAEMQRWRRWCPVGTLCFDDNLIKKAPLLRFLVVLRCSKFFFGLIFPVWMAEKTQMEDLYPTYPAQTVTWCSLLAWNAFCWCCRGLTLPLCRALSPYWRYLLCTSMTSILQNLQKYR